MKKFAFTGTTSISRKFSVEIFADSYEEAEEQVVSFLEDTEDPQFYQLDDDEIDINIQEYEEKTISARKPKAF